MRLVLFLSMSLLTSGCILDWERGSSAGGNGGSGGEAGASVESCDPPESCQCEGTPGVTIGCVCDAGGCVLDCGTTTTCTLECGGGGCEMSCTSSATCGIIDCLNCSLDCGSLNCCYEDGESTCLALSNCTPC